MSKKISGCAAATAKDSWSETPLPKAELLPTRQARTWLEFIPISEGKVKCPKCRKIIGHQRIARGAHAAWCLSPKRANSNVVSVSQPKSE